MIRNMQLSKEKIAEVFRQIQDDICQNLVDNGYGTFEEDLWERPGGGGGRTRAFSGGIIEKGGVNFSEVHGVLNDQAAKNLGITPGNFFASGVSIVLHPDNPNVPIIHMNIRYFELADSDTWWFGGGIDLTPHIIDPEEARAFHFSMKRVCDAHDPSYHQEFKEWADRYFFISHRQEARGIGGIFFDRMGPNRGEKATLFQFVKAVGNAFFPTYHQLAFSKRDLPVTDRLKAWQGLRRGRYVEFNLVWDRGTKFGLHTNGRTESILMSMPPQANWEYMHQVIPDSAEDKTLNWLKNPPDWLNYYTVRK